ncbi:MAG: hypothetical protein ACKPBU_05415 [Alphaproteobacteria bacterium]
MPANEHGSARSRARGVPRLAAGLLVALVVAEIVAAVALAALRREWWPDFPGVRARRSASSLDAHLLGADGSRSSGAVGAGSERATLRIDPHLGWVHAAGDGINNAGFRNPVDYPFAAPPGEMVVGVFGGSVAESLCSRQRKRLENGLREVASSRGYASVRVLCFAIVGHREPQGLFAFERYADTVDFAIFLEGFNEVVFWSEPGYPADFPNVALWRPFANAPSPREVALSGRRDALAEERTRLADSFDLPVVRHSAAAQLAWEVLAARLDRARVELDVEADEVARAARTGRDPSGFDEARARDRYLVGYEGTLRDAAAIGRRRRVPVLLALQPNQYVDGSKPFTAEEEERFRGNAAIRRFVAAGWPKLRATWASASGDGVDALDLTDVFAGTGETVYGDDCCHLNDVGNRLLAERLVAEVASRPSLVEAIAPPGARPERLRRAAGAPGAPPQ